MPGRIFLELRHEPGDAFWLPVCRGVVMRVPPCRPGMPGGYPGWAGWVPGWACTWVYLGGCTWVSLYPVQPGSAVPRPSLALLYLDLAWLCCTGSCLAWLCCTGSCLAWLCSVWPGSALSGWAWLCSVWLGLARSGCGWARLVGMRVVPVTSVPDYYQILTHEIKAD